MKFIAIERKTPLNETIIYQEFKNAMSYKTYVKLNNLLKAAHFYANSYSSGTYAQIDNYEKPEFPNLFKSKDISKLNLYKENCNWLILAENNFDLAITLHLLSHNLKDCIDENQLKIIIAEEHIALLETLLSEGLIIIPKLIALDKTSGKVKGLWGVVPEVKQQWSRIKNTDLETDAA